MSLRALDGPATYDNKSVSTTPVELRVGASALNRRKVVTIQPLDGDVYFGYDNSVTSSNGIKVFEGQFFPLEAGDSLQVWLVASTGTVDVRISEIA